jgi:hypothetical protein
MKPTTLPRGCLSASFDCSVACFLECLLKFSFSVLKSIQFLLEIRYLFLDLSKLSLSLDAHQVVFSKLLNYALLELASQDSEVWVSPHRTISVFKSGGLNASDDEVTIHTVLNPGCYVAKYRFTQ